MTRDEAASRTLAELRLYKLIQWLNQKYAYAGWLEGCEFVLYGMVLGGPRDWLFGVVEEHEVQGLRDAAMACGGWFTWTAGEDWPHFVPIDEWVECFFV